MRCPIKMQTERETPKHKHGRNIHPKHVDRAAPRSGSRSYITYIYIHTIRTSSYMWACAGSTQMQTPQILGREVNMQEVPGERRRKSPCPTRYTATFGPAALLSPGGVLTRLKPNGSQVEATCPHVLLCMPCNYFELNSYFVQIL